MNYSVKPGAWYVLALLLAFVCSCDSNNETVKPITPSDYLPMKKGLFFIYDVTETKYVLSVPTTSTYELKTVVVDSIANANSTGGYDYVIYRYKRLANQSSWTYLETWSASINQHEAVVNESNISFLKFMTPISTGLQWNGNTYNNKGNDEYTMKDVGVAQNYSNLNFPDCITVQQADNGDLIVFFDQRKEVFSKDVGLIYKEITQLNYCTTEQSCLGKQSVEEGVIYKQTIKSYGKE